MVTSVRTAYEQLLRALEYLGSVPEVRARNRALCDPTASFSILSRSKRKQLDAGELLAAHRFCEKQLELLRQKGFRLPPIQELYESELKTEPKQERPRKVIDLPRREPSSNRTPVQREATEEDYERIIHQLSSAPNVNELVNVKLPKIPGERDYLDHQRIGIRWLLTPRPNEFSGGLLADQMGLGKAQPLDAAILTPTGWTTMGQLKVGDRVIGGNGKACNVIGVFPQGSKEVFKVTFSDGTSTECCKEHLWAVKSPWQRYKNTPGRVLSLEEILERGLTIANGNRKHFIPMVAPIEFDPQEELPLDAYAMGALLANGGLTGNTPMISTPDAEIIEFIRETLPDLDFNQKDAISWSIVSEGRFKPNRLTGILKDVGIHGHLSIHKFIPDCYKFASVLDRIKLLQGLLDGDGNINEGSVIEYNSSSEQLALDVRFLVESLGGRATWNSKIPYYTKDGVKVICHEAYRLIIALPHGILPFRVHRKAALFTEREKYLPSRAIASVESIGVKECQCIAVDDPEHLYITNNCIVTHNTLQSLIAARLTGLPIFVVTIASALDNWGREVLLAGVNPDLVTICSWDNLNKWTYDSKPPVERETKSKTKKPKAFGKLEPIGFLAEEDFIVILDESHYAQTITSQRTQHALAITRSEHCKGAYLLTGTPMPNAKPKNIFPLLVMMRHPLALDRSGFEIRYCDAKLKSIRIGKGEKQQERRIWDDNGAKNLDELAKLIAPYILLRYTRDCVDLPPIEKLLHECDLTPADRKIYEDELKEMRGRYQDRVQREEVMDNPAVALDQLRQAASRAKVPYAAGMARHLVAQGDQVILFTWFKETARRLAAELGCEIISGDVDPKKRQPIIDRFESGQHKEIVCTFGAGSTAINLIAGNWVLSLERPYVPGIEEQSSARSWRIGQTKNVTVMWLRAFDVDEIIDAMVQRKSDIIDLVIRGKRKTLRGIGKSAAKIAQAILPALLER